jgi:hypothetical protein
MQKCFASTKRTFAMKLARYASQFGTSSFNQHRMHAIGFLLEAGMMSANR